MAYDQQVKRTINALDIVPTINASPQANTTGNITTSTTAITANDLTGVGSATVQFKGTFAGINVTFEASPDAGTTWVAVNGQNVTTGAMTTNGATGVLTANTTVAYNVTPLLGFDQFRVRATAFTSGSAAVVIHTSSQFVQTSVAVLSAPTTTVTGTVTSTIAAASNTIAKAEDAAHTTGDTGIFTLGVRNDGAGIVLTSANLDYSPYSVDSVGTQYVRESPAVTSTITQVTPAAVSTTLKAANTLRKSLLLYNGGTGDLYVAYGATASTTAFSFILPSLGTTTIRGEEYSGLVTGIWSTAGGNSLQVTEIV